MSAQELALVKAIQRVKTLSGQAALCRQVGRTYAPETRLMRAYRGECLAYIALARPNNDFDACVKSIPQEATKYDSNRASLTCNIKWFPKMTRQDLVLDARVKAVDAALEARAIPVTGRCGEIFALGPGVPYNLLKLARFQPKLTQLAARLLKSRRALEHDTTKRFQALADVVGAAQKRFVTAAGLSSRFVASVCKHAAD